MSSLFRKVLYLSVLFMLGMLVAFFLRTPDVLREMENDSMPLSKAMKSDTTGYERATGPIDFSFPEDHGAHPTFKTEWWYYTGNVIGTDGRRFGFQLTFFRSALSPMVGISDDPESDWISDQLYMAHFSMSDVENETFYASERFSRGSLGLAGAEGIPYRIWLDDWSAEQVSEASFFPTRLIASEGDVSLDLVVDEGKPAVYQGDRGYDQKGDDPGNASYYYSFTRLPVDGTISIGEERFVVSGQAWKDHEWSTSALGEAEVGWDWFSLQLSDGRDLMVYSLRQNDGSESRHAVGMVHDENGTSRRLNVGEYTIETNANWTSPKSGITYPSRWTLSIPSESVELEITPRIPNQELNVTIQYWEGAVSVEGISNGSPVTGSGFVELTGYQPN
ncbi:MAG: carotenoid 1,2-hydratase [Bacteroidetes Order II. Incertae sedis bacterium]|jgi:predicted secreted hydrolase|nr:carotenoid 1,2-hydratase [Bacteroidetes Order II. bacterium]MBT4052125.1 carotenoid 1,2-hydratase [Bacteroidetes Order II. bacterium]MBT4602961.1 carotenoid 1,2-hydratase [Bacteroidetes Order II. bacterium]MBT6200935.1 carotenoid 1,2-hydratase [Bacteroidetes Order II. bacterium]MBT6424032.1 carotenoid 1,2-hydratase [Bacteroidetes Order II. bacterium]